MENTGFKNEFRIFCLHKTLRLPEAKLCIVRFVLDRIDRQFSVQIFCFRH